MGTIEKLFLQIFERKKWIEDQVKRQTLLFDHQLASKCLIDGIAPPPWLFSCPPNDLNKEELISGLLLPLPPLAVPYSGNCCSLYNKPDVPADKGDLPLSSFTEVHSLSEGFDAGDRLSVSPQLPVNDVERTSNGIQKGDSDDVISLLDQRFEKPSNASPEPAHLLENFQRSKSRQRALALRNSAKLFRSNLQDENNAAVLDGGITGSEIATLQHGCVRGLELDESVHISKESCKVEEANLSEFHGKENESCVEELISPLILGPQPVTSHFSYKCVPFDKPAVTAENEELAYVSNKELHVSNKGLVAEDGPSNLHQSTVNDAACVSNGALKMDFGAASPQDQTSSVILDIDPEPLQSLARVQRSKSRQRALKGRNSAKAEKIYLSLENDICVNSSLHTGSGITTLEFVQIGKSELVQTADFDNKSCEVEGARVHDFEIKEKSSNIYRGKITRSKKSVQPPSSVREDSHADSLSSAGKSSRDQNNVCCLESNEEQTEDSDFFGFGMVNSSNHLEQRKVGGRQNYSHFPYENNLVADGECHYFCLSQEDNVVQLHKDRTPVDKMNHVDQLVSEGSRSSPLGIFHLQPNQIHESELVETAVFVNESCEVEGAKAHDFHSKERSSNISSGTIRPSRDSVQRPSSMKESSHAGTLAYAKRSSATDNNEGSPESSEQQIEENYASFGRGFGSGMVGSSPELKQRQVEGKIFDAVLPAPCFREDGLIQSNENRSPVDKMDHVDQLVTDGCKSSPAGISPLQADQFRQPELIRTSNFNIKNCKQEAAKVYDFQGKEKSSSIYSVRIMKSRSSDRQPSSAGEFSQAGSLACAGLHSRNDNYVGCLNSSKQLIEEESVPLGSGGSGSMGSLPQFKQRKAGDRLTDAMSASPIWKEDVVFQSNEDRSPVDKLDHEEVMTEGFKSSTGGISSLQPVQIQESELVKTADLDNESCEAKGAKLYDFQSKEKSSSIYSGRIRRSQISVQQYSSMRESSYAGSLAYSGRSSRTDKNVGSLESGEQKIEENSTSLERGLGSCTVGSLPQLKQRNVGSRTNAVSAAPSLREDDVVQSNEERSALVKMDHLERVVTEGSKLPPIGISSSQPDPVYELEYSKPADGCCESCVVKEATIGDIQSEENSSIVGSTGITISQTYNQQQFFTMDSYNKINSFYPRRSNGEDRNVDSSEWRQKSGKKPILPGNNSSCGAEDSWPQHKRRKVEAHLNDSLSASASLREDGVAQSGVNKSLVCEMDLNGDHKMKVESQSLDKLQVDEDISNSKERNRSAKNTPFSFVQEPKVPLVSSFSNQGTNSKYCSVVEGAVSNTTRAILDPDKQCAMGGNDVLLHLDEKTEKGNSEHLSFDERGMREGKCHLEGNGRSLQCSVGSPQRKLIDLIASDQIMPEFEGFILETNNGHSGTAGEYINFDKLDLPKTAIERASVLEELCKSACMNTPLSHFFTTYKLHQVPNLHQSVPNGLLECIDQRINPSINDNIIKQLKASYSCFDEEASHAYQGRSYSDCSLFSSTQLASDIRKPFGSPIGKFWDRISSNSTSSEKRGSSNPELPCISEENENTDEVVDAFQEGISLEVASPVGERWDWTKSNSSSSEKRGSLNPKLPFISEKDENTDMVTGVHQGLNLEVMPSSVKREPLADITENPNLAGSVPKADVFAARSSLESVKTEFTFSRTIRAKQKHGDHISNKKNRRQAKISHGPSSFGENGINRVSHNRFTKPKLSEKPSLRKGGQSFADRESKHNNIVSNINSFIPLVQQKQAAAIITGKRDVKVKALEAAEAAKRLAVEKENERKMKKEALKLERAKLEQENLKQLGLQKKKKEEERKKKEADMAVRKRQREEEVRKDKERKRKRVMESRKQQQEHEEKLRRKKEEERKKKEADLVLVSNDETWGDFKNVKQQGEENLAKMQKNESKATVVSTSDARETSIVLQVSEPSTDCGDKPKATSHLEKATENDLVTNQNQEPSYDISPYKDSDNEEEEDDDDRLNTKFIPSWASKHDSALVISSLLSVSPEVIFPPGSFCSISEVLLPRRQQQKMRP